MWSAAREELSQLWLRKTNNNFGMQQTGHRLLASGGTKLNRPQARSVCTYSE